jgi:hypothetical protein
MAKAALAVLYDVEWQRLRVSLLTKYNDYGGFGTIEGVQTNLMLLGNYVRLAGSQQETFYRNWRVLNLLDATLLGYGTRMQGTAQEGLVRAEVNARQERHKAYIDAGYRFGEWNWEKVARDLNDLYESSASEFANIKENLQQRIKTAMRKERLGTGGMQHRSELILFMELMQASGRAD